MQLDRWTDSVDMNTMARTWTNERTNGRTNCALACLKYFSASFDETGKDHMQILNRWYFWFAILFENDRVILHAVWCEKHSRILWVKSSDIIVIHRPWDHHVCNQFFFPAMIKFHIGQWFTGLCGDERITHRFAICNANALCVCARARAQVSVFWIPSLHTYRIECAAKAKAFVPIDNNIQPLISS